MVSYLEEADIITGEQVKQAFHAIDRGNFIQPTDGNNVYDNMPIRAGMLHLSAPGIYGMAVEALNLRKGCSFLNIGSGTGCDPPQPNHTLNPPHLNQHARTHMCIDTVAQSCISAADISAVAAQLLGPTAIHYGIEHQQQLVDYARAKLDILGLSSVHLICGSCFAIDQALSMRFDRIYVGAGADEKSTFLMQMLEVGSLRLPASISALPI